jgi:hypothetical protein
VDFDVAAHDLLAGGQRRAVVSDRLTNMLDDTPSLDIVAPRRSRIFEKTCEELVAGANRCGRKLRARGRGKRPRYSGSHSSYEIKR